MGVIWPGTLAIGEEWWDGFGRPVDLAILGLVVIRIWEWRDRFFCPW